MSQKGALQTLYFFSKSPIPQNSLDIHRLKDTKGSLPDDLTSCQLIPHHSNRHLLFFRLPPTREMSLYAVVQSSGRILSWHVISDHLSFPVFFVTKSGSLQSEPIPSAKRSRKLLHSTPDLPRLFAKLHLQWLDFSITDRQAIGVCFDFSFRPHRFNHFAREIESFQNLPKTDPHFSDFVRLCQLFLMYRPNGLGRDIASYPGYIGDLVAFLVDNRSADLKSLFLSVFFERLTNELFENSLFMLAGAFVYALELGGVGVRQRFAPIELPKTAKKRVFEANRESLAVVEEFLPVFGAGILLRSYLIEFDLAFRELGRNWGELVESDAVCEVLVGRVALDPEIKLSNLEVFESFTFQFMERPGNAALADYRIREKIPHEVWLLFELASEKPGRQRQWVNEEAEESRGFVLGFPKNESAWELPKYELCDEERKGKLPVGPRPTFRAAVIRPVDSVTNPKRVNLSKF
jgi:hypothetical protein